MSDAPAPTRLALALAVALTAATAHAKPRTVCVAYWSEDTGPAVVCGARIKPRVPRR